MLGGNWDVINMQKTIHPIKKKGTLSSKTNVLNNLLELEGNNYF